MFENIIKIFKKLVKSEEKASNSKDAAKERLHLVLMQDRANVSADFLDLMRREIIEVIKKYIEVDENAIDVRLTNKANEDGTTGAPALYANIPIMNIKNEMKKETIKVEDKVEEKKEVKEEKTETAPEKSKEEEKEVSETKDDKEEKLEEQVKKENNEEKAADENIEEKKKIIKKNKKVRL